MALHPWVSVHQYFGIVRQVSEVIDRMLILCYSPQFADAGWSSLAARRAHNPKVVGSNPAPATQRKQIKNTDWRNNFDLYNAHLFATTVATAKAGTHFKIQIKQSISVGMWTGALLMSLGENNNLKIYKVVTHTKSKLVTQFALSEISRPGRDD